MRVISVMTPAIPAIVATPLEILRSLKPPPSYKRGTRGFLHTGKFRDWIKKMVTPIFVGVVVVVVGFVFFRLGISCVFLIVSLFFSMKSSSM